GARAAPCRRDARSAERQAEREQRDHERRRGRGELPHHELPFWVGVDVRPPPCAPAVTGRSRPAYGLRPTAYGHGHRARIAAVSAAASTTATTTDAPRRSAMPPAATPAVSAPTAR